MQNILNRKYIMNIEIKNTYKSVYQTISVFLNT